MGRKREWGCKRENRYGEARDIRRVRGGKMGRWGKGCGEGGLEGGAALAGVLVARWLGLGPPALLLHTSFYTLATPHSY